VTQTVLRFGANADGRGGAREGAGRPKTGTAANSHRARPDHTSRFPVPVTLKLAKGLPQLRRIGTLNVLASAFYGGKERFGFRLNHYSVQDDHLHLIVEATDRAALSRGMKGLNVRIAKTLNKLWKRTGQVFPDRYHESVLTTPKQVRNALAYVFKNARKHGHKPERLDKLDIFTSGAWFDGWRDAYRAIDITQMPSPVTRARTWLQTKGWRRHGLVPVMARG
jgi:REP element-mobilizing transposase RayT